MRSARRAPRGCDLGDPSGAIAHWHGLLRPDVELSRAFADRFSAELRAARLTFGSRVHCQVLRPYFLGDEEVALVRRVSEAVARAGETVAAAALDHPAILDAVALDEDERRLAAIDPGYARASTASRLDSFILPDGMWSAEYNGESPAGLAYTETLAGIFDGLDVMARFRERYEATAFPLMEPMLDALLASYREWGGTAAPPTIAIVDWRDVPTWSEFELLQARFVERGVPTIVCDPRELAFDGTRLSANGQGIDLVYRRVLINDLVARPDDCAALLHAYAARAVCVANTLRCKIPHKKAFFAVLTDDAFAGLFGADDLGLLRRHVPWTRLVREGRTTGEDGREIDLVPYVRARRDRLVLKPNDEYGGAGVTLGWEADEAAWDATIARAAGGGDGHWVVQARIPVSRERFQRYGEGAGAGPVDMLVDCAPYLFRGRMAGFLTRLSATGLANVTSGGGQVPSFVVRPIRVE